MQPDNPEPPAATPPLASASKSADSDMLEDNEHVLTVVRRSLVGLVAIYLVAIIAVVAVIGLAIAISPSAFESDNGNFSGSLSLVIFAAVVFVALILFVVTYIYRQSRLLVTDKSLIQVMQKTLFIRKVSRLSMSNVEDVNEEQRGFWATFFNFGTLTVQTAGTEDNFIFTLCPNPAKLADRIIEARQQYAKSLEENQEHQNT